MFTRFFLSKTHPYVVAVVVDDVGVVVLVVAAAVVECVLQFH